MTHMPTRRLSTTVPSDLDGTDIGELFNMEQGVSERVLHPTDRVEVDVDTLPTLEPYRREVVAQQPITFGHRPLSASRMFNPCTMATSCGIPSDGHHPSTEGIRGRKKGGGGHKGGSSRKRGRNSKPRRTTGLSAPMLKALLRGDTPTGDGGAALVTASQQQQESFEPNGNIVSRDSAPKPNYLVVDGQEDLTDSSVNSEKLDESMWRSVDDLGRGEALGELESWLQTSSQEGLGHGRRRLGNTKEGLELQRIFSSEVRNQTTQAVPQTTFLVPQHSWSMVAEVCFSERALATRLLLGCSWSERCPTHETVVPNVLWRPGRMVFHVTVARRAGFRGRIFQDNSSARW